MPNRAKRIQPSRTGHLPSFHEGQKTLKARDLQSLSDGIRAGTLGTGKGGNGILMDSNSSGVSLGINNSYIRSIVGGGYDDMAPFEIRWHKGNQFAVKGGYASLTAYQHELELDAQSGVITEGWPYKYRYASALPYTNVLQKEQFSTYVWGPTLWPAHVPRDSKSYPASEVSNFDNCYIEIDRSSDWIVHVGNATPSSKFPPDGVSWSWPGGTITRLNNDPTQELFPRDGFRKPQYSLSLSQTGDDYEMDNPTSAWARVTYTGATIAVLKREGPEGWRVLQNITGPIHIPNDPALLIFGKYPAETNGAEQGYNTFPNSDGYWGKAYLALRGTKVPTGYQHAKREPRITSDPSGALYT